MLRLVSGVLVGSLSFAWGDTSAEPLPAESPFLPAASADSPATRGPASFEFVGATTLGQETLLGLVRQQDKRSFWIPVGTTVSDIAVVSYNARTDEAVIRAGSEVMTLKMRTAGVVAGPAVPASLFPAAAISSASAQGVMAQGQPPVSVPTKPLNAQEEKEMEARMLVTDLLEIGQQQRKAYAQAELAARAKKAAQPPVSGPAGNAKH